jgi:predicted O-methyltransferase YrrM
MSKRKKDRKEKRRSSPPIVEFIKNLHELDIQDGHLTDTDAFALIQIAKKVAKETGPPLNFLEMGSWKGKSTICLATVTSKYPGSKIYCIDHFKGNIETSEEQIAKTTDIQTIFRNNLGLTNAKDIVCLLLMDIKDTIGLLQEKKFDLIFIDMDNRYQTMLETLKYAITLIKPGGVICGRNLVGHYPIIAKEVDEVIHKEYSQEYKIHPGIIKAVFETFGDSYKRIASSSVWYWEAL